MTHNPGFLKLVERVKHTIRECTVADVKAKCDRGEQFHFVDVRGSQSLQRTGPRALDISAAACWSGISKASFQISRPRSFSIAAEDFGQRWQLTVWARWATPM